MLTEPFLENLTRQGLSPAAIEVYETHLNLFRDFCSSKGMRFEDVIHDRKRFAIAMRSFDRQLRRPMRSVVLLQRFLFQAQEYGAAYKPLSQEEFEELLTEIASPVVKLMFEVLWYTGIRARELLSLSVGDVDLKNMVIRLRLRATTEDLPIPPPLATKLQQYTESNGLGKSDSLFVQTSDKVTLYSLRQHLMEATRKLGWGREINLHTFRVSYLFHNGKH